MIARAVAVLGVAAATAAPACPGEIDVRGEVLVPVEDGYVTLVFRDGVTGRARVEAPRLVAGPAIDRVVQEPWPSAERPNLEYDGQLGLPWPTALAGALGTSDELIPSAPGSSTLRRAGRQARSPGTPDVLLFEGDVPLVGQERAVGVEWLAFAAYPGAPPWATLSPEQYDVLWCPLTGPCVGWERATHGTEDEPPRIYCVDEEKYKDPSATRWRLFVCDEPVIPDGLRIERSEAPPVREGLVRTAIRAEPGEYGDYLLLQPGDGQSALKWTLTTRNHDEFADGRTELIPGCATGASLRVLGEPCSWLDEAGPTNCRYEWLRTVGANETVEIDFYDGATPDYVDAVWIEMSPGLCLAATTGAPAPGTQYWWAPDGPMWPAACDLAEQTDGLNGARPGCPRDPPASLEWSREPVVCQDGVCRAPPTDGRPGDLE